MKTLAVILADLYVEKYLYGKDKKLTKLYDDIIVPFLELHDTAKSTFLSYMTGRVEYHIVVLNEHIEELKKEINNLKGGNIDDE